jgi:RNA polymerase sigma-70 factor, ECF subfamily
MGVMSCRRLPAAAQRAAALLPAPSGISKAQIRQARLDWERVQPCLGSLTRLQRESVTLAYDGWCTVREVAAVLGVPEATVKTGMRDGLIWPRDCRGAA